MSEECPGEGGCHGCLRWCDFCGDVGHVCDYPQCDTHQRETDVLRKLTAVVEEASRKAGEAKRWEERLTAQSRYQTAGATVEGCRDNLRRADAWCKALEEEIGELEEELKAVQMAGKKLVPRPGPERDHSKQLDLFRR